MFNNEDINMIIDKLMQDGGIEWAGLDANTSENLYRFTPKLKEIMPELYNEHINMVNAEMMSLWEKGFIDIDFLQDNPTVSLTKKASDIVELSVLSDDEQWALSEIIYSMIQE